METALIIGGSVLGLGALVGAFFAGRAVGQAEIFRAWDRARAEALRGAKQQPKPVPGTAPEVSRWLER